MTAAVLEKRRGRAARVVRSMSIRAQVAAGVATVTAAVVVAGWSITAGPGAMSRHEPVTVVGHATVSVQPVSYRPGEARVWEPHDGLHAVTVLSGTLTVYDRWCRPHSYRPGESYAAGWDSYMAVNETAAPAQTEVSYMPPSAARTNLTVPPPSVERCPGVRW